MNAHANKTKGWHYAALCYVIWGTFPIYWSPLNGAAIGAEQILAHRVLWSAVFAVILLIVFKQTHLVLAAFRQPKVLLMFTASALFIGINWLVYLWAILNHHVLDASLGYFINPLVSVFLGWLIFKEKLNKTQIIALFSTLCGIAWLAMPAGQIPWIALLLASSFAAYTVMRKLAPMDALAGLALETILLFPFAFAYLAWSAAQGELVFRQLSALQIAVLLGSGVMTTVPLICFAAGARRITLSLLGMLQYISPTLQFICGLFLFHEAFDSQRLIGFSLVWLGVLIFLWGMRFPQQKAA